MASSSQQPSNPSRNLLIAEFLSGLDGMYERRVDDQGKKWYWAVDEELSHTVGPDGSRRYLPIWRWIEFCLKFLD